MINYIIIDDEHLAHDIIKGYCDLLPNMNLLAHCYDALEAMEFMRNNKVDLMFLDLNMPKLMGFDYLKTLTAPPKVIVTTAYSEFALEGYEHNVVDYLLKPFGFERFLKAINKLTNPETKKVASSSRPAQTDQKFVFLRSNKKYIQVQLNEILFLESAGNYVKVFTESGIITVREKLSELIALLSADLFLQTHKSFAVAIRHIKTISGNSIQIEQHSIPIGKLYKMNVTRLLSN